MDMNTSEIYKIGGNFSCYTVSVKFPNAIWKGDSVLTNQVPLLTLQIAYNILVPHFLYFFLKPLHVPILVAQILAGLLLNPALFGQYDIIFNTFYRQEGVLAVETCAHLGIVFYVFLSGLEMDSNTILRTKKKSTSIAVTSIIIPMLIGVGFSALEMSNHKVPKPMDKNEKARSYLFWCLTLSVTSFPVLAKVLAELKLLYTKLGQDALTAAMFIDAYGWILFTLLIPYSNDNGEPYYSVVSTMVFILFCFCVLQPILNPIIERKTTEETWTNKQLACVLMGTFVCSYITDLLGAHPFVGAFVFGLILPHGKFADLMIEISNDVVTRVISPLYFSGFGFRINFGDIVNESHWFLAVLIVLLLSIPKVIASLIVTFFYGMPARDGAGIGLLLNTKGIMAVILLNIAWDKKILDAVTFSVMALAIIIMTLLVSPLINAIYKPKFAFMQSQRRTIQKLRFDAELRVVACVHNARQATGIIHILEATNPTRFSPIYVFALHLVELTRQGIALIAAQLEHTSTSGGAAGVQQRSRSQQELESITDAFEEFVEQYNAARFEASSAVSSYATIHEDIYSVTDDKRASLILLPFHKELNSEGDLEITNNVYRDINLNVLRHPPCSVGIFVDHGLKSLLYTRLSIIMLFIGGPDDREALALAWRMAGHSGIHLSVVRILLPGEAIEEEEEETTIGTDSNSLLSTVMDSVTQRELDDEYIFSFKHKAMNNNEFIGYSEREVHTDTGEEIPLLLSELDKGDYDLYIVGQGSGKNSSVLSRLLEWCDNPELGVIGDIVASTSFGTRSSLLVVQQYEPGVKSSTKQSKKIPIKKDDPGLLD